MINVFCKISTLKGIMCQKTPKVMLAVNDFVCFKSGVFRKNKKSQDIIYW